MTVSALLSFTEPGNGEESPEVSENLIISFSKLHDPNSVPWWSSEGAWWYGNEPLRNTRGSRSLTVLSRLLHLSELHNCAGIVFQKVYHYAPDLGSRAGFYDALAMTEARNVLDCVEKAGTGLEVGGYVDAYGGGREVFAKENGGSGLGSSSEYDFIRQEAWLVF
ncbi:hypothetical protein HYFRA_00014151 [Hymenoscyphus fraxineus]|uniref:Uncharacterized protein n=1 Tax=Hymenoscyphus fraxineus TaxID=746836 RepID=A0A9N9LAB8_9HELO|nr:hypothetical protein HYFRA_00014151 [Hymenoscyphus fraxineus]